MSRIISYPYDDSIKAKDAWVGTDEASRKTKQYTAEALAEYLNISGSISIIGQMTYKYGTTPLNGIGTLAVFGGGPDIVAFSAVVKLTLSNQDISNQRVVEFLDLLVGSDILIAEQGAISTFGYYSIDSYAINATDSNYYDLGVTFKSGNGSMRSDRIYEAQNFTLSAEENISTLQTTIDSGNTYQENETSPLWTWGAGEITTTSTSFTSILSGKRFKTTFIDDGSHTDVLPNQINFRNASGNETSITTNTSLSSNIDLQWPSASGTLALTTDITASPWDTVTGGINYANGNVGIGTTTPEHKLEVVGGNVHFQNTESSNTFLDVQGNDANAYIRAHSGSNSVWLYQGGSSSYLQAQAGSTLRLGSGTSNLVITNTSGEVMRISGSNVGIGTTSPSEKLEVSGGIIAETLFIRNGDGYNAKLLSSNLTFNRTFTFPDNEGTLAITSDIPSASQWDDVTGGINYANGNVGIGTTSPSTKLEIYGNVGYTSGNAIFPRTKGIAADWYTSKYDGSLNIDNSVGSSGNTAFRIGYWGSGTFAPNIKLSAGGGNTSYFASGNVGIGTTSPIVKLDVVGTARFADVSPRMVLQETGNAKDFSLKINTDGRLSFLNDDLASEVLTIKQNGNVGIGTTSPTSTLHVVGTQVYEGYVKFENTVHAIRLDLKSSSHTANIYMDGTGGVISGGGLIFNTPTSRTHFTESGTPKMSIISGKVGIGTTSPGQKLEVDGQVLSDGYRLAAMQTAPATRNSTGTLGEIVIDGNHIYVCYATDSWSRVALETSW
jgi:hypothetical protein